MSAIRSGLFLASKAASRRPVIYTQAFRTITTATPLKKREVIAEKEVPVSSYTPDARGTLSGSSHDHYSIPVRKDPKVEIPVEDNTEKVVPLSRSAFHRMPATMQKMTAMDKVVIITG
jgi:hypothetical protein